MRVAFLTYSFSMHINIKAKYFMGEKDKVFLFGMNFRQSRKEFETPLVYKENLNVVKYIHEDLDWKLIVKNTLDMLRIIKENKIQIVHIIDMAFAIYGITLGLFGVNVVLENNGSDVILAPNEPQVKRRYKWAYKLSKGVVQDSFVAQTAGMSLGAPKENNRVIELGIDVNIFNPQVEKGVFRKKYNIPDDAKVIFSPRTLRSLCNISKIIDTIKPVIEEYPNTYYIFCSQTRNIAYESRIKKEGLDNHVIYLGYVDNEKEMPYIYRDSDVVISIPSSDSSPRSVYEAIACGSNVIVSELPWIGDKFKHGRELFVVGLHDKQELLNQILSILSGESMIDENISFTRVDQILNYHIAEKSLKRLYRSILRGNKNG